MAEDSPDLQPRHDVFHQCAQSGVDLLADMIGVKPILECPGGPELGTCARGLAEIALGVAVGGGLGFLGKALYKGIRRSRALARFLAQVEDFVALLRRGPDCVGNSFVAGTPVLMADGSTKPIEEAKAR